MTIDQQDLQEMTEQLSREYFAEAYMLVAVMDRDIDSKSAYMIHKTAWDRATTNLFGEPMEMDGAQKVFASGLISIVNVHNLKVKMN
jgi:hypothetical protein